ncbi:MAG: acyl-CoA thioesterase [Planctomycetota bacterium]|jgi:acyl-CoA hydrolase
MTEVDSRRVSESMVEMTEIIFPNDANPLGKLMGGRVMQWVDSCAAIAAGRHARTSVVTASVDQLNFHRPVPVGAVVVLLASVNYAGHTSMEVGVKVFHEERATGRREHVVSAYLTFVSLDGVTGKPRPVVKVVPETKEEKRRYADAERRRQHRLECRKTE